MEPPPAADADDAPVPVASPPSPVNPLDRAFDSVRSPAAAERVADDLAAAAAGLTCEAAGSKSGVPPPDAPPSAAAVIVGAAATLQTRDAPGRATVAENIFRAANPQADVTRPPGRTRRRDLLRTAFLPRLRPLDRLDAVVFMAVNRMPHPAWANRALHFLSAVTRGGNAQTAVLLLAVLPRGRRGLRDAAAVLPAFWLATAAVEVPVKRYFRRRRPFLTEVAAVVIGRRPGSFSFPSGHTAAAFAFATLAGRRFPRAAGPCWVLAALVGFSRVYLGAHYPGDVLTGAVSGGFLARVFAAVFGVLRAPRRR